MNVQDTRAWEEAITKVFDDFGYLLNESGIVVSYEHRYTGPGGDWDAYVISITGCDSGERDTSYTPTRTTALSPVRSATCEILRKIWHIALQISNTGKWKRTGTS